MGQGQSVLAVQLLRDCARDGHWLCLKNLHLVTSWLPVLEKVNIAVCSAVADRVRAWHVSLLAGTEHFRTQ